MPFIFSDYKFSAFKCLLFFTLRTITKKNDNKNFVEVSDESHNKNKNFVIHTNDVTYANENLRKEIFKLEKAQVWNIN